MGFVIKWRCVSFWKSVRSGKMDEMRLRKEKVPTRGIRETQVCCYISYDLGFY